MTSTEIDLSQYATPGRSRGLLDVFRRNYLLRLLVRKGVSTRYRNSALGWIWSYTKPLSQYVIYYFIMGVVLGNTRDIDNFAIYLLAGIIAINFFNEAFGNATTAITGNSALVRKIYLPRELFPISAVIVAFVHFLPQLAVLLVVAMLSGWLPTWMTLVTGILGMLIIVGLASGLGLLFGAANVLYRDAQNFVDIIKMFAIWTAPVMYSWEKVANALPNWAAQLYMMNPLATAVELFHRAFWYGGKRIETTQLAPHIFENTMIAVAIIAVLLTAGQLVFRKLEPRFAQEL